MCIIPKQDHGFITYGLSQTQKHKTQTHINYPCTEPLIIKAHSHWRIVEFQAEPQNLLFPAEFLCFCGILQNLIKRPVIDLTLPS